MNKELERQKQKIQEDLRRDPDDSRYEFCKPEKFKSEAWLNFESIKFNKELTDFVRCINCKHILTHHRKTGTASLLRHKCLKLRGDSSSNSSQQSIKSFTVKKLPESVKTRLRFKQLKFISKDLRPLNITEGEGFKEFAQELINVGATYGKQNIEDVLVSRRTITRTVIPEEYNKIKEDLKKQLSENHISFTTDLWTDEYTQRNFLTLSAHFIDSTFKLKRYVLGTREFTEKKTGLNIQTFVLNILEEFKARDKLLNGVIVTDNGANIVSAFRPYKRLSCACHVLNLVMQDVLEGAENDKVKIPELKTTIVESKKLVTYFKHSELNSKLSKSLKQHVSTRWNSMFVMLESITEVFNEIQNLLSERNELYRLCGINYNVIKSIVHFLKLFTECSQRLSSDLEPTLNEFILWQHKLKKHCESHPDDSDLIRELKKLTKASMEKRFQITEIHCVALFLNPKFKSMKVLSEAKQETTLISVADMLRTIKNNNASHNDDNTAETSPSKKLKTNDTIPTQNKQTFEEYQDSSGEDEGVDDVEQEIETYKKMAVNESDVLLFWREAKELPLLRQLARKMLAIPASSATSERLFSKSGRILEERRTRLISSNLDKLLFLNQNYG